VVLLSNLILLERSLVLQNAEGKGLEKIKEIIIKDIVKKYIKDNLNIFPKDLVGKGL